MHPPLRRSYTSRYGTPTLDRVDERIFTARYFARCMDCTFCHDQCCTHGVDVDVENHGRIVALGAELEERVGLPRSAWFTDVWTEDTEFPGGRVTRTAVRAGRCVFLDRSGRGCLLHSVALARGEDYHTLKPMVSALFPLTFDEGLLHPSEEVADGALVCLVNGKTVYRGVRDELLYYFGAELVGELDLLESQDRTKLAS